MIFVESQTFAFALTQLPNIYIDFFLKQFILELEKIDIVDDIIDLNNVKPLTLKLFREHLQRVSANAPFYFENVKENVLELLNSLN
jgi:hypothetical protein